MTRRGVAAVLVWAAAIGASAYWLDAAPRRHDRPLGVPACGGHARAVAARRAAARRRRVAADPRRRWKAAIRHRWRRRAVRWPTSLPPIHASRSSTNGDASRLKREQELVFRWRYLLSPATTPERFTADGLRAALDEALRLVASPLGPLVKQTLPADPTGEMLRLVPLLAGGAQTPHDARRRSVLAGRTPRAAGRTDARAGLRPRCAGRRGARDPRCVRAHRAGRAASGDVEPGPACRGVAGPDPARCAACIVAHARRRDPAARWQPIAPRGRRCCPQFRRCPGLRSASSS